MLSEVADFLSKLGIISLIQFKEGLLLKRVSAILKQEMGFIFHLV